MGKQADRRDTGLILQSGQQGFILLGRKTLFAGQEQTACPLQNSFLFYFLLSAQDRTLGVLFLFFNSLLYFTQDGFPIPYPTVHFRHQPTKILASLCRQFILCFFFPWLPLRFRPQLARPSRFFFLSSAASSFLLRTFYPLCISLSSSSLHPSFTLATAGHPDAGITTEWLCTRDKPCCCPPTHYIQIKLLPRQSRPATTCSSTFHNDRHRRLTSIDTAARRVFGADGAAFTTYYKATTRRIRHHRHIILERSAQREGQPLVRRRRLEIKSRQEEAASQHDGPGLQQLQHHRDAALAKIAYWCYYMQRLRLILPSEKLSPPDKSQEAPQCRRWRLVTACSFKTN